MWLSPLLLSAMLALHVAYSGPPTWKRTKFNFASLRAPNRTEEIRRRFRNIVVSQGTKKACRKGGLNSCCSEKVGLIVDLMPHN